MKKIIIIIICFLLISCNRNGNSQDANIKNNTVIERTENVDNNYLNKKMYVNTSSGLNVRNIPSTEGERIGILNNYTEINIIIEEDNVVNINGTNGKWVFINSPIEGWIFNGFLTDKISENISQSQNKINNLFIGSWQNESNVLIIYENERFIYLIENQLSKAGDINIYDDRILVIADQARGDRGWYEIPEEKNNGYFRYINNNVFIISNIEDSCFSGTWNRIKDYFIH